MTVYSVYSQLPYIFRGHHHAVATGTHITWRLPSRHINPYYHSEQLNHPPPSNSKMWNGTTAAKYQNTSQTVPAN